MKNLKVLFTVLCMLSTVNVWAETVNFTMGSGKDVSSNSGATKSGITITATDGTSNANNWGGTTYVKLQAGGTITISSTNTITQITLNCSSADYVKTWNASVGTMGSANGSTISWTGSATSVTLTNTAGAQSRINSIDVTTGSGKTSVSLNWFAANYTATIGGANTFPTLTVKPEAARTAVAYSSTDETVATINASGEITLKKAGSTTIKASRAEDATYSAASEVSYALTVNAPAVERTVTWYVNSEEYTAGTPTTRVNDGSKVTTLPTEPSAPDDCSGKVFVGWTTAKIETAQPGAPTVLFKDAANAPIVSGGDASYYAVFADEN